MQITILSILHTAIHVSLCIMETSASLKCRSVASFSDHALTGYTYKVTSGIRFESCAATCDADPHCYSFNYVIRDKTCELSNSSRSADSEYFVRRSGVVYMDKLTEPVEHCKTLPCRNNGTCQKIQRHPGFECFCQDVYRGEKCEICSPTALGLGDNKLPDQNFNASSSLHPFRPSDARLHAAGSSWVSDGVEKDRFLQISFQPHPRLITSVATEGSPGHDWWVVLYNLQYSLDGVTWFYYENENSPGSRKVFNGNQDRNSVVTNQLHSPIRALYLRISPLFWTGKIALRVEIYGCNTYS